MWIARLCALGLLAMGTCHRAPTPSHALRQPRTAAKESALRTRAAGVTIRFASGAVEPGSPQMGNDRLQIDAAFADIDRRDFAILGDLVGQRGLPPVTKTNTCLRIAETWPRANLTPTDGPHAWVQLLDVGNVSLQAGNAKLPLRVQLVPDLSDAIRGVRYSAFFDQGRSWLAMGPLHVQATGGDGVAAFDASIEPPRPVRLTFVGSEPVRDSRVRGPEPGQDLALRWGSTDGQGDVEVQLGSADPASLGWLLCRLQDDGEFTLPTADFALLPQRTAEHPWLIVLQRVRTAPVAGFAATPLRLEITDSAYLL